MAEPKVAVVTGASSGIGRETARLLSERGFRAMGTRLPREDFDDPAFETVGLDITSEDSVSQCVEEVVRRTGRIDLLINNAGVGLVGMVEETTIDEARSVFETNYFGTLRVIRAVLPVMRAQGSGRIVNVSSVAGNIGVPYEAHYCAAKLALASLTRALRWEVAFFGVDVLLVSPGYAKTPFYAAMRKASCPLVDYDEVRSLAEKSFEQSAKFGSEARAVAKDVVRAAMTKFPGTQRWAGPDAQLYGVGHRLIPDFILDWIMRRTFTRR